MPIQKREASGAEFNGIIDLLATGDGKRLILDHKSGAGSFAGYFAQLDAYRGVLPRNRRRHITIDSSITGRALEAGCQIGDFRAYLDPDERHPRKAAGVTDMNTMA